MLTALCLIEESRLGMFVKNGASTARLYIYLSCINAFFK
jgi:hypothetical protein